MATTEEIKKAAILVRDATQIGENTAERVGGVLVDLANKSKELEDNIETKADTATVNAALDRIRTSISTEVQDRKEAIAAEAQARKDMVSQELGEAEDMVISQKTVTENLLELQRTVFPLQVSLSLDKNLLEFTGNDQAIKVTYSVKRKDVEVTPTALGLSVNGTIFSVDLKPSDTVTVNVNKEGESTIVLTAKYSDLIKSVSAKVTMVLPIYCGFGTSEADVAIAANKLEPRTSATGVYEKTSPTDDVNFIILVPKTLEGLSSFTMGGAPFVMNTSSVAINGKDYYMYKSGGVYMSGTTLRVLAG